MEMPGPTGIKVIDDHIEALREARRLAAIEWQKMDGELRARRSDQQREGARDTVPSAQRVQEALDSFGPGTLDHWWHLNFFLTDKGDGAVHFDFELDLRSSPGWGAAEPDLRARFKETARTFLLLETDVSNEWSDGRTLPYPVAAGLRAWFLLLEEGEPLPEGPVWDRWIDVMVRWPFGSNGTRIGQRFNALITEAARRNDAEVHAAMSRAIEKGPVEWDLYLDRYRGLWTDVLAMEALDAAGR